MNAFTESVVEQAALDWFGCFVVVGSENPVHENAARETARQQHSI